MCTYVKWDPYMLRTEENISALFGKTLYICSTERERRRRKKKLTELTMMVEMNDESKRKKKQNFMHKITLETNHGSELDM